MTDSLPPLPDLNHDTDRSDAQPTRSQPPMTFTPPAQQRVPTNQRPVAPQSHVQAGSRPMPRPVASPPSSNIRRVSPSPRRRRNTLILPWWSLFAMLMLVMFVVFGMVGALVALSQRPTPQAVTPIIRIITAQPTVPVVNAPQATSAPVIQLPGIGAGAGGQLALEGPTLPAIVLSTTPVPIAVGNTIVVTGVGAQQLNVRDRAAVQGSTVLFRAPDGTRFTIIGGPQQGDNFIWWQIQDVNNPANSGWAVSNYLQVITGG